MKMKVLPYARARGLPDIKPYVYTMRIESKLEYADAFLEPGHYFNSLMVLEFCQALDVPEGDDHEMGITIREFIHNYKTVFSSA
jgi:hypothetical protein